MIWQIHAGLRRTTMPTNFRKLTSSDVAVPVLVMAAVVQTFSDIIRDMAVFGSLRPRSRLHIERPRPERIGRVPSCGAQIKTRFNQSSAHLNVSCKSMLNEILILIEFFKIGFNFFSRRHQATIKHGLKGWFHDKRFKQLDFGFNRGLNFEKAFFDFVNIEFSVIQTFFESSD